MYFQYSCQSVLFDCEGRGWGEGGGQDPAPRDISRMSLHNGHLAPVPVSTDSTVCRLLCKHRTTQPLDIVFTLLPKLKE